jgi:hypothetical protein
MNMWMSTYVLALPYQQHNRDAPAHNVLNEMGTGVEVDADDDVLSPIISRLQPFIDCFYFVANDPTSASVHRLLLFRAYILRACMLLYPPCMLLWA